MKSPALRQLAITVLIAAAYFIAAELAFEAAVVAGSACPIWPATAVALVAVLRLGRRAAPGILIGILAANATRPVTAMVVGVTAIGNLAEPYLTRAVLRRLSVDTELVTAHDVARFIGSVACGAVASVTFGVGSLYAAGFVPTHLLAQTAALWWLGNTAGAMCVAPLVLVPGTRGHAGRAEELLVLACALLIGVMVLDDPDVQVYVVFPVLIWAGLRLGPRGAAAVAAVFGGLTVIYAARGDGPFVQGTPTQTLLTCQGFIVVTTLTTLLLAAINEDRRRAGRALHDSEESKRALAEEQAALRRIAEAAARSLQVEPVLRLAGEELRALLGVEAHVIHDLPPASDAFSVAVVVGGETWGAVVVSGRAADPERVRNLLPRVADLVSLAVANAQSREYLEDQATTDPLTGLLNHRAFHERLREEVARARRHDRTLSVAVFDIDHFKAINDTFGHARGDVVLAEAARRLRRARREGELAGRIGGDELAVILPEVDGIAAHQAAERLRRVIGTRGYEGVGTLTASSGTCDLAQATDAEHLLRLADGALYWAKAHGRDVCFRYSPEVVEELSADERAERLSRSQALSGIRALARAIDAKDSSTIRHSERVAELVGRLAERCGWSEARIALLREAGLVHDVGKIGVPDAILCKRGRLTPAEYRAVQRHAELGEDIAREVLGAEQASWIRSHHERHDGTGYPDGLRQAQVPDGAQLLALADAWDAMTRARPYSEPMSPSAAIDECRLQSGRQFAPHAVAALEALHAEGQLEDRGDGADVGFFSVQQLT